MQVIEIKTTPGKYELEVTPAKLEYDNDTVRDMHVQTTPSTLKLPAFINLFVRYTSASQ